MSQLNGVCLTILHKPFLLSAITTFFQKVMLKKTNNVGNALNNLHNAHVSARIFIPRPMLMDLVYYHYCSYNGHSYDLFMRLK